MSRVKFLLQLRKDNGEHLSPDEEAALSCRVVRRKNSFLLTNTNIKQEKGSLQTKNLIANSIIITETRSDFMKTIKQLPKIEKHASLFLKKFLTYTNKDRTVVYNSGNKSVVRAESDRFNLKTQICNTVEKFEEDYHAETQRKNNKKLEMQTELKKIYQNHFDHRTKQSDKVYNKLKEERELIRQRVLVRQEIENKLLFIFQMMNEDNFDINVAVSIYKDALESFSQQDRELNDDLMNKVHHIISCKKDDFLLKEIYKTKDKNICMKYIEDIKTYNWKISDKIIEKLNELIL